MATFIHPKVCEVCTETFCVTKTRINTARFCSRNCQSHSLTYANECSLRQRGSKSWRWKGGICDRYVRVQTKTFGGRGYLHRLNLCNVMLELCPNHPFLVYEDRKWKIKNSIDVHHIDHNPLNNEITNLMAVPKMIHAKIHYHNYIPTVDECWSVVLHQKGGSHNATQ